MTTLREKWDKRYQQGEVGEAAPARVLSDYLHLLPSTGRALDLACGLGANALLLARSGLFTDAWDLSPVAIRKLEVYTQTHHLPLTAEVRDVLSQPPPPALYDVIVVAHFLERTLCSALCAALRPGGLLFYQTFAGQGPGPANPAFRLAPGELFQLFAELAPLVYREEGDTGNLNLGLRGEALLVAQKPKGK